MATFYHDGTKYELPALSLSLQELQERADSTKGLVSKTKARFAFLEHVFSKDELTELCGAASVAKADAASVGVVYSGVISAYYREERESDMQAISDQVEQLSGIADLVQAMSNFGELVGNLNGSDNRQKFSVLK